MLLSFSISLIGLFLLLLNVVLFNFNLKNKNKQETGITIYLSLLFVVEVLCHIIGFTNPGENYFLSHYYFNIQFVTLSFVFYQLLNNKMFRIVLLSNLILIPAIIGYTYIKDPSLYHQFNVPEISLTSAAIAVYALIYLLQTIELSAKFYYFSIGLLLYLLNSLFIFLSGNTETVFITDPYIDIWIFNSFFYIIYQIFVLKNWKKLNELQAQAPKT